jgi:hypothetical protein
MRNFIMCNLLQNIIKFIKFRGKLNGACSMDGENDKSVQSLVVTPAENRLLNSPA